MIRLPADLPLPQCSGQLLQFQLCRRDRLFPLFHLWKARDRSNPAIPSKAPGSNIGARRLKSPLPSLGLSCTLPVMPRLPVRLVSARDAERRWSWRRSVRVATEIFAICPAAPARFSVRIELAAALPLASTCRASPTLADEIGGQLDVVPCHLDIGGDRIRVELRLAARRQHSFASDERMRTVSTISVLPCS